MPQEHETTDDLTFDEWRRDVLSRADPAAGPVPVPAQPLVVTLTLWPIEGHWPLAS